MANLIWYAEGPIWRTELIETVLPEGAVSRTSAAVNVVGSIGASNATSIEASGVATPSVGSTEITRGPWASIANRADAAAIIGVAPGSVTPGPSSSTYVPSARDGSTMSNSVSEMASIVTPAVETGPDGPVSPMSSAVNDPAAIGSLKVARKVAAAALAGVVRVIAVTIGAPAGSIVSRAVAGS